MCEFVCLCLSVFVCVCWGGGGGGESGLKKAYLYFLATSRYIGETESFQGILETK